MNPEPHPLHLDSLRRSVMAPDGPYARLELVAETGSTNADLVAAAAGGHWPDLSALAAESQLAGRGRLDRTWTAPPGSSIIVSVLLRPAQPADGAGATHLRPLAPEAYSWLSLLAAVALAEALQAKAGVSAELKWPNDVLIGGRKVAGILAQLVPGHPGQHDARWPAVVIGTGVNVSQSTEQLPVPTATSLALEGAADLDRNELLATYLNRFAQLYRSFRAVGGNARLPLRGGDSLLQIATARMATLGSAVRAELPGGVTLLGTATGLDQNGSLLVADSEGTTHTVSAGDVVHLRRHEAEGPGAYA